MNYELCKKLKDAGFPQNTLLGIFEDASGPLLKEECPKTWGNTVAYPSLAELIEACGDGFGLLVKDDGWTAANGSAEGTWYDQTSGKTPEEAVANLWLELNKH